MNGARELNELISFVGGIKDNPYELSKLKNTGSGLLLVCLGERV
ncbi:MAG: hypothetical protein RR806_05040 [Oscillospiraceae bacterium]